MPPLSEHVARRKPIGHKPHESFAYVRRYDFPSRTNRSLDFQLAMLQQASSLRRKQNNRTRILPRDISQANLTTQLAGCNSLDSCLTRPRLPCASNYRSLAAMR